MLNSVFVYISCLHIELFKLKKEYMFVSNAKEGSYYAEAYITF